ncbi:MAG TPA: hypothetical protein PLX25_06175 [Sphaerochaeta sp.]|nr:hypothetical protein [Sphaerochaeta sp.]
MKRSAPLLLLLLLIPLASLGAASTSWQQIWTSHTRIIFAKENAEEAAELASYADEVLLTLSAFLENRPSTPVPVILVGHTAWANGYYINFPSAIHLYIPSPEDRFLGGRTQDWLKSVYTHELTHYLHRTSRVGIAKYLSFLGPAVTSMYTPFMPGWWVEGVTTYSESTFTEYGGRGDSSSFAHRYQAPLGEGRMWSLAQGSYASGRLPSDRIYLTGFLMVDYLARHYGAESFALINRMFAAFPFFGLSPAIKQVTGHSAKEIFSLALEERAVAMAPAVAHTLSHQEEDGNHYLFAESAIGRIGFFSSPTGGSALVRYSSEGRREVLRPLGLSDGFSLSLGEDSALFSFLSIDALDGRGTEGSPVGYSDLYLLDLHTLKERRLTVRQRLVRGAMSRDGRRAVASQIRSSFHDLVEVDLESGELTTLMSSERTSYLDAALNRDGSLLAVIAAREGNSTLLLDSGEGLLPIVGPTSDELARPRFTDDGSLLFTAEGVLYRYDRESGVVTALLVDALGVYDATIIDGDLYYQSYSSRGFVIKEGREGHEGDAVFSPPVPSLARTTPPSYPVTPFRDHLLFNLALPYPVVTANRLQPSLFLHFSSLLRRQSLALTAGWSIDGCEPVADITYQALIGRTGLALEFSYGDKKAAASTIIDVPLLHAMNPAFQHLLRLQGAVGLTVGESTLQTSLSLALQYVIQESNHRGSDFYGPSSLSVVGQGQYITSQQTGALVGGASVTGQLRLFSTSAMARADLSVASVSPPLYTIDTLLPLFSFTSSHPTATKARLSASICIPFGLLDIPIPYGGMSRAGIEVEVQKALYFDGSLAKGWAVGATLSAELLMGGSSFPFKPFVTAAYLIGEGRFLISVGLDAVTLFTSITLH